MVREELKDLAYSSLYDMVYGSFDSIYNICPPNETPEEYFWDAFTIYSTNLLDVEKEVVTACVDDVYDCIVNDTEDEEFYEQFAGDGMLSDFEDTLMAVANEKYDEIISKVPEAKPLIIRALREVQDDIDHENGFESDTDIENRYDYGF